MKNKIVNLTMHLASPEQKLEGVFDLPAESREMLLALLNISKPMSSMDLFSKSLGIIELIPTDVDKVMIGGHGALMPMLELAIDSCLDFNVKYGHSFSDRVSSEYNDGEGNVIKTSTFKHIGWIPLGCFDD